MENNGRNEQNYRLLGLDPQATDEEITARYESLKNKYKEERWLEGEAGNEAARMLGKVEAAYAEIMQSRKEGFFDDSEDALKAVTDAIHDGDLVKAQKLLDGCNERNAEWHYLQSVLFYRKSWINESKKQLEIAMQMDAENAKYKDAYDRIIKREDYRSQRASEERSYNAEPDPADQMGGTGCAQCIDCCTTYLCVNCLFNLCCGCR